MPLLGLKKKPHYAAVNLVFWFWLFLVWFYFENFAKKLDTDCPTFEFFIEFKQFLPFLIPTKASVPTIKAVAAFFRKLVSVN